jgi:hypothetical protein
MTRTQAALLIVVFCTGCATQKSDKSEQNSGASSLLVEGGSAARSVLLAVPPESAMERFGMVDRQNRHISYVAFTDTDYGGLMFVDEKLYGSLSKRDARAFYSCRGYTSATHYHWARDAAEWTDTLFAAVTPAKSVMLNFSGKSTMQSVKEVVSDPLLSDVRSLVGMGTNPFSIFSKLSSAHSNMVEREKYDKTLQALRGLSPGDSEEKVAQVTRPEDLSFTIDGMVMAYPRFSLDFYVNGGSVKVIQQPSFHRLSRLHAAIFYLPDLRWDQCTPQNWRQALPADWKPPTAAEEASWASEEDK